LKTLAAMITRMDGDVGRLLALLAELGLDDRTLVFFASDNGGPYADKLFQHNGPLRGRKRDMYEGGIRTPAIARWPGKIPAGKVSDQVWAFCDFLPTMAALTGQTIPTGLVPDGISILSVLLEGKTLVHPPLYYEFHERGFDQGARIGNWKAVKNGVDGPIELYDLTTDLGETHDLAADRPDLVARFADFFKTARVDAPLWPIRGPAATKVKARSEGGSQ
jgi:arylsulfatase A-like enzyme